MIGDSDSLSSECESLTRSIKHVKYGSTGNRKPNERFITHVVQCTDTLQGLALKYEVSMEQIKRANKLWSSDSLALRSRPLLNIPIPVSGPTQSVTSLDNIDDTNVNQRDSRCVPMQSNGSQNVGIEEIALYDDDNDDRDKEYKNMNGQSKFKNGFTNALLNSSHRDDNDNDDDDDDDESAADFLIRIDSSIAKSRDKVTLMQQNRISSTHSDNDLFRHQPQRSGLRRHHSSSSRPNSSHHSSLTNIHGDVNQPYVMTHGRKVKSSLKRLEMANDELFQL